MSKDEGDDPATRLMNRLSECSAAMTSTAASFLACMRSGRPGETP
jgi:hypothetical protein